MDRIQVRQVDGAMGRLKPLPKQAAFLLLPQKQALYGGSAGGGKSAAILMGALQYVHVPYYSGLLLRRTLPQLEDSGGLLDLAVTWLRPFFATSEVKYNADKKTFRFKSGAKIKGGYLDTERDLNNFAGPAFQYSGIDEGTQFPEHWVDRVDERVRGPAHGEVPWRLRIATNPGDIGHEWVKKRFVDAATREFPFLPSKLVDNPYLNREEYEAKLMRASPTRRKQMLEGSWENFKEGAMFHSEWFKGLEAAPLNINKIVRYWDCAATEKTDENDPDFTVGVLLASLKQREGQPAGYVLLDAVRGRWSSGQRDMVIRETAMRDGKSVPVQWEEEGGSSGKDASAHFRQILNGFAILPPDRKSVAKIARWGPLASQAEAGNLWYVTGPWNTGFFQALQAVDPDRKEIHDDDADALSGAYNTLALTEEPALLEYMRRKIVKAKELEAAKHG